MEISKPIYVPRQSVALNPRTAPIVSGQHSRALSLDAYIEGLKDPNSNESGGRTSSEQHILDAIAGRQASVDGGTYAPTHRPQGIIIHLGENAGEHSDASSDTALSSRSSEYSNHD